MQPTYSCNLFFKIKQKKSWNHDKKIKIKIMNKYNTPGGTSVTKLEQNKTNDYLKGSQAAFLVMNISYT
jgi:hypothetical protein